MDGYKLFYKSFIVTCFALFLLSGCKAKTFEYVNEREIPEGPGVFTGESGEWTVYDSEARKQNQTVDQEEQGTAPDHEDPPAADIDEDEYEEFKQYQEWKREQQDFEAFQEWKKTSQGTREYQEFKEWQEWKDYKEWQKQQEQHD